MIPLALFKLPRLHPNNQDINDHRYIDPQTGMNLYSCISEVIAGLSPSLFSGRPSAGPLCLRDHLLCIFDSDDIRTAEEGQISRSCSDGRHNMWNLAGYTKSRDSIGEESEAVHTFAG